MEGGLFTGRTPHHDDDVAASIPLHSFFNLEGQTKTDDSLETQWCIRWGMEKKGRDEQQNKAILTSLPFFSAAGFLAELHSSSGADRSSSKGAK